MTPGPSCFEEERLNRICLWPHHVSAENHERECYFLSSLCLCVLLKIVHQNSVFHASKHTQILRHTPYQGKLVDYILSRITKEISYVYIHIYIYVYIDTLRLSIEYLWQTPIFVILLMSVMFLIYPISDESAFKPPLGSHWHAIQIPLRRESLCNPLSSTNLQLWWIIYL